MEQMQAPNQMTPDDDRAALGFSTQLMQQHLQSQMPQEAPQAQETAPQQEEIQEPVEDPQAGLDDLRTEIMDEIGSLKELIKENAPKDKNKELEDLKKQINDVINEPDETTEA